MAKTPCLLVVLLLTSCSDDYGTMMASAVMDAVGDLVEDYEAISYPTTNFGLATAYDGSSAEDFICDMWNCLGVADDDVPEGREERLRMAGYAALGKSGPITLTREQKDDLALNLMLPKIYEVLKIGGSYEKERVRKTELSLGSGYVRFLRRDPIIERINSLDNASAMKRAFLQGDLVLVVGDIVLDSIKVSVELDENAATEVDAAIGAGLEGGAAKILRDAKLELKVTSGEKGKYTFEVNEPVIALRLTKKQPGAGKLGTGFVEEGKDPWSDWAPVDVDLPE